MRNHNLINNKKRSILNLKLRKKSKRKKKTSHLMTPNSNWAANIIDAESQKNVLNAKNITFVGSAITRNGIKT